MKIWIVFDDTGKKSEVITDIIGEKGFAQVVVKKRRLESYYQESVGKLYPEAEWKWVHSLFQFEELAGELERLSGEELRVLHCFSNFLISDEKKVLLSYEKLRYVDEPYRVLSGNQIAAVCFPDAGSYLAYCGLIRSGKRPFEGAKSVKEAFSIEGLVDIGRIGNFIQCITGNFDSRYFNSLQGDEYTLVKSSKNKKKIKSEYTYYYLLPEDMRFWYVMPFDYEEDEAQASYRMERLHITDLAIKWVHGSVDEEEFEELMDKFFYFFRSRHQRSCTKEEYEALAKSLYMDKVRERISELKALPEYEKIGKILAASGDSIDDLADRYFQLKEQIEKRKKYPYVSVIGHGDPCFANTLYNRSTKTLKFIDPKGALTEEELWTNPYYDVAKLSHSVCGRYDFFNNALFDIRLDESFSHQLDIRFDHTRYMEIFRKKAEENGFDFLTVRIYEASLFLSMLPLHMDNPFKVLGFILNVKMILKEIGENV